MSHGEVRKHSVRRFELGWGRAGTFDQQRGIGRGVGVKQGGIVSGLLLGQAPSPHGHPGERIGPMQGKKKHGEHVPERIAAPQVRPFMGEGEATVVERPVIRRSRQQNGGAPQPPRAGDRRIPVPQ